MIAAQENELFGEFTPTAVLRADQIASLRVLDAAIRALNPATPESKTTEELIGTAFAYAMSFIIVPPADAPEDALTVAAKAARGLDMIRQYQSQ
jgi:hypothetical protein